MEERENNMENNRKVVINRCKECQSSKRVTQDGFSLTQSLVIIPRTYMVMLLLTFSISLL